MSFYPDQQLRSHGQHSVCSRKLLEGDAFVHQLELQGTEL